MTKKKDSEPVRRSHLRSVAPRDLQQVVMRRKEASSLLEELEVALASTKSESSEEQGLADLVRCAKALADHLVFVSALERDGHTDGDISKLTPAARFNGPIRAAKKFLEQQRIFGSASSLAGTPGSTRASAVRHLLTRTQQAKRVLDSGDADNTFWASLLVSTAVNLGLWGREDLTRTDETVNAVRSHIDDQLRRHASVDPDLLAVAVLRALGVDDKHARNITADAARDSESR
jgi:hypothetical protein